MVSLVKDNRAFIKNCTNPHHYNHIGTIIGINNNVPSFLNCDNCYHEIKNDIFNFLSKNDANLKEDLFTGCKYQCVEYSRRWLILNRRFIFGDVSCANKIFDKINFVTNVDTNKKHNLIGFTNGSTTKPEFSDILIFPVAYKQNYGHVGIITGVNLEKGFVEVSEQNNDNKWESYYSYSRRLPLIKLNDLYYIIEYRWHEGFNERYLKSNQDINYALNRLKSTIIGWKRIEV